MPELNNNTATNSGVEFIINTKKPFPDWLKNHAVFKQTNTVKKIFPSIGLPNFKEETNIMNTAEALAEANRLGGDICASLRSSVDHYWYTSLDGALKSSVANRNEICGKMQLAINLANSVWRSLRFNDYAKTI